MLSRRIALASMAAVELINPLHRVAASMTQAGMLKAHPPNS